MGTKNRQSNDNAGVNGKDTVEYLQMNLNHIKKPVGTAPDPNRFDIMQPSSHAPRNNDHVRFRRPC